jgi:hypothetical protein
MTELLKNEIPAFAGMTGLLKNENPAFAGMTQICSDY